MTGGETTRRRFDFDLNAPKRPLRWVVFGAVTALLGGLGWWLGGNAVLGVSIVGLSLGIALRALGTRVREANRGWLLAAIEVDVEEGRLHIIERRALSTETRSSAIRLAGAFEGAEVFEWKAGRTIFSWSCLLKTELFYLHFPMKDTRAEAVEIVELLQACAGATDPAPDDVSDGGDAFDVDRSDGRTEIRWRLGGPAADLLRMLGLVAILFGATPLLDVAWGIGFGLVAVVLGVLFVSNLGSLKRNRQFSEKLVITPERVSIHGTYNPDIDPSAVRDVDLTLVSGGGRISSIELQMEGRLEDEFPKRDLFSPLGDATEQLDKEASPSILRTIGTLVSAALQVGVRTGMAGIAALEGRWVIAAPRVGFVGTRALALTIREELVRVAGWERQAGERRGVVPADEEE